VQAIRGIAWLAVNYPQELCNGLGLAAVTGLMLYFARDDKPKLLRFSWKWRRRSPIKLMERTHEEATEALRAGREGRHPAPAFAGEGADLEAL
jgi:hypothetical protein